MNKKRRHSTVSTICLRHGLLSTAGLPLYFLYIQICIEKLLSFITAAMQLYLANNITRHYIGNKVVLNLRAILQAPETVGPFKTALDLSLLHPVIVANCFDMLRPCNDFKCYDALEIVGAITIISVTYWDWNL